MRIIGIDPGINGGAFFLDTDKKLTDEELFLNDLPEFESYRFISEDSQIDSHEFYNWITSMAPDYAIIEKPFLTGMEGGQSALTIGANYGRLMAAIEFYPLPLIEVSPRVWQRALGLKGGSRTIVKQEAQDLAVKRFTLMPFLFGRSKKPHDGCTDAACIALYGQIYLSEQLWKDDQKKTSIKSTQVSASSTGTSATKSSTSKSKSEKPSKTSSFKKKPSAKKSSKPRCPSSAGKVKSRAGGNLSKRS